MDSGGRTKSLDSYTEAEEAEIEEYGRQQEEC